MPRSDDPTKYLIGKRFGEPGGANQKEALAKGHEVQRRNRGVRAEIKRISEHEFDTSEGAPPIAQQIKEKVFGNKTMTGAQILAATRFAQGIKNFKAMQNVVEDIDGKLKEVKEVRANIGYAELVAGSMEDDDATLVSGVVEGE